MEIDACEITMLTKAVDNQRILKELTDGRWMVIDEKTSKKICRESTHNFLRTPKFSQRNLDSLTVV